MYMKSMQSGHNLLFRALNFHTAVFTDTLFTVLAREELLTIFAKTVLAHFA